jgi:hypothetical protein
MGLGRTLLPGGCYVSGGIRIGIRGVLPCATISGSSGVGACSRWAAAGESRATAAVGWGLVGGRSDVVG